MAIVQLAGYAAFIVASVVLGTRLLLLWRRTREWPELTVGASFWLGGVLGYSAWLVLGILSAGEVDPETVKRVATIGLGFTVLGAMSSSLVTVLIFRPRERWAPPMVTRAWHDGWEAKSGADKVAPVWGDQEEA